MCGQLKPCNGKFIKNTIFKLKYSPSYLTLL